MPAVNKNFVTYQPSGKVNWFSVGLMFLLIVAVNYMVSMLVTLIQVSMLKSDNPFTGFGSILLALFHLFLLYLTILPCVLIGKNRNRTVAIIVGITMGVTIVYFHYLLFFSNWFLGKSFAIVPSKELLAYSISTPVPIGKAPYGGYLGDTQPMMALDSFMIYGYIILDTLIILPICIGSCVGRALTPYSEKLGRFYNAWKPSIYFKYVEDINGLVQSLVGNDYTKLVDIGEEAAKYTIHCRVEIFNCPGDDECYLSINNYRFKTEQEEASDDDKADKLVPESLVQHLLVSRETVKQLLAKFNLELGD